MFVCNYLLQIVDAVLLILILLWFFKEPGSTDRMGFLIALWLIFCRYWGYHNITNDKIIIINSCLCGNTDANNINLRVI